MSQSEVRHPTAPIKVAFKFEEALHAASIIHTECLARQHFAAEEEREQPETNKLWALTSNKTERGSHDAVTDPSTNHHDQRQDQGPHFI